MAVKKECGILQTVQWEEPTTGHVHAEPLPLESAMTLREREKQRERERERERERGTEKRELHVNNFFT